MYINRRGALTASIAAIGAAKPVGATAVLADAQALLSAYTGFGNKASGGAGDIAAGEWMEKALQTLGFQTERQQFSVANFDIATATLAAGGVIAPVQPQAIVIPTAQDGVAGQLSLMEGWAEAGDVAGRIVVISLGYGRWSTAMAPAIQGPVRRAINAGASAVVLITNGPSHEAISLNADGATPMFDRPVAILAPKDAGPILKVAAAGGHGRLRIEGVGGRRRAFNVIGRLDRGQKGWLVVSTPRSGWHVCAGERGSGVAVWMMLARWAAASLPVNLAFACNSAHEYENLGAAHLVQTSAPRPHETRLWVHLGANVAARDWHELGSSLVPLPSADSQRILMATADVAPVARAAFAGLPGLEAVYPTGAGAAGELGPILAAGYPSVLGAFGAHRFHHTDLDDSRCVSADLTFAAFVAFQRAISTHMTRSG